MIAPSPVHEEVRLTALSALKVLDTLPEAEYEDLVLAASALLDAPTALVSLVDRDRQWFKARLGFGPCETSRDVAFCAHAILRPEPLVVPDATLDPRFFDNELVTGPHGVRFYAGAPIVVDGHAMGTLCCLDTAPRRPTDRQIEGLAALARLAGALLKSRADAERFAQSERRFAAFLDHSPAVAFVKDENNRMRYVNRQFEAKFDRPAADVLGRTDFEWLPEAFADACAADDEKTRREGSLLIEEEVPLGDGRTQLWQTHKFAIDLEGGRWVGGIATDVTDLRRAESTVRAQNEALVQREEALTEALQEAETSRTAARLAALRFEQLFAGLPVACFTYGSTGTIHEWNGAAEALWGIRADEALLGSVHDVVVGPENQARQAEIDRRVFAGETVAGEERHERMRDGRDRWLLTSTFPLRSPSGIIVGAVCANVDVTERKRAEEEVREKEARFRTVVESLQEGLTVQNEEGHVLLWNPSAQRIVGVDITGTNANDGRGTQWRLLREDGTEYEAADLPISRAISTGEPQRETVIGVETAEGLRWLSVNASPLAGEEGRAREAVSSFVDITERRRMEAEIREKEARLRTVLDSLHEGVVVQDAAGAVSLWNRSAERILGIGGERMDLRSGGDPRANAVREDGTPFPVEERPVAQAIRHNAPREAIIGTFRPGDAKGAEPRWYSVMAVPLPAADGGPAEFAVASFLDITERRRMEAEIREKEGRLQAIVDSLHEGLMVQNAEGRTVIFNPSATRMLGMDISGSHAGDRRGKDWRLLRENGEAMSPDELPVAVSLRTGESYDGVVMGIESSAGDVRWLSVNAVPLRREGSDTVVEAVASFVDITERRRMELALRESEARFRTVVESLSEGLVVHDEAQRVVYSNRSAERILGLSGEQLRGRGDVPEGYRVVNEDGSDAATDDRPIAHALRTGRSQEPRTLGIYRTDGDFRWISVGAVPILPDDGGRPREAVASFLDITQRIEHERQIQEYSAGLEAANARLEGLATTDGLTGLKNHRYFQDWLRRRIEQAQAAGLPLSIALLDVDKFKTYNDDFGHQAGDAVLRGVAAALERSVRGGDLAARYGGEEFVLVMPGADETEATRVAERVRLAIAALPFPDRAVTASFGLSTLDETLTDAPAMIRAADEALYRSKDTGRNRVTHCRALVPALPRG